MRHPWQIWLLFALCLAMVLPAMAGLTYRALQLDRAEALAQRQAELEQAVGSALWQLDTDLTRLLAAEVARPASFYQSFYVGADPWGRQQQIASPLLVQPSPYVRLHFEIRPDGSWSSPQSPEPAAHELALLHDATPESIRRNRDRLEDLAGAVAYEDLLARLPQQHVQTDLFGHSPFANTALLPAPRPVVSNTLDFAPVQQQLEIVQWQQADLEQLSAAAALLPEGTEWRNQRAQSRRGGELQSRNEAFQAAAQQAIRDQRLGQTPPPMTEMDQEGISQPLWVGPRLLLARRVVRSGQTRIQGCWLDWPRIKAELLQRIVPWLPDADLEPLTDREQARFSRVLATLPVQLVVPETPGEINPFSPLRVSLMVAWAFLALATVALAAMLRVVVALSERRAAFVSAVTHELRTPLTTFRLYAEMLADDMICDPTQRREYLETLRVEADRLSHLVENVLQYARLERGASGRRERVSLDDLLERIEPRLQQRAAQAAMTLEVEADEPLRSRHIATDPAAVEQILFNLVDNACKYARGAADRRIHCSVRARRGTVEFQVRDHGPGIAAKEAGNLFRPFSKSADDAANSAPGVGLGLALCRRLARQLGGRLQWHPSPGGGAAFTLRLPGGKGDAAL